MASPLSDPTVAGRDMPAFQQRDSASNKKMKAASKTADMMIHAAKLDIDVAGGGSKGTRANGVDPKRFFDPQQ